MMLLAFKPKRVALSHPFLKDLIQLFMASVVDGVNMVSSTTVSEATLNSQFISAHTSQCAQLCCTMSDQISASLIANLGRLRTTKKDLQGGKII
jgi:hypothetical protein